MNKKLKNKTTGNQKEDGLKKSQNKIKVLEWPIQNSDLISID